MRALALLCSAAACGPRLPPGVLVQDEPAMGTVAVDDAFAYWATTDGRVRRIAKTGGDAQTLADGQQAPTGLFVDARALYWTTQGDWRKFFVDGTIVRWDKATQAMTTIVSMQPRPWRVQVNSRGAYWVDNSVYQPQPCDLRFAPADGSAPKTLADNLNGAIDLALDDDGGVTWLELGRVARLAPDGTVKELSSGKISPVAIAWGGGALWWTDNVRVLRAAPPDWTATIVATQESGMGIAADANGTYWVNRSMEVRRLKPGATVPETIATGVGPGDGFAMDSASVFWIANLLSTPNSDLMHAAR